MTDTDDTPTESGKITINRAPVLTLWAAVVAEELGYDHETSLTLGKAVAGLNAQSKGRSLGIFGPPGGAGGDAEGEQPKSGLGEEGWVVVCDRAVPVKQTESGLRAVVKDKPIEPAKVVGYLERAYKDSLGAAADAMSDLASAVGKDALDTKAYDLYVAFRPEIPKGRKGWGAKGALDLEKIRSLGG